MCATVIWAINAAAYGQPFIDHTEARIGTPPQPTDHRIASPRVRPSAVHFTLTRRMCDCDGIIGLGDQAATPGETTADQLLAWLRDLPSIAPHVTRLAILRAWSPADGRIQPLHARGVEIAEVDEALLRAIPDDGLVTIDYR